MVPWCIYHHHVASKHNCVLLKLVVVARPRAEPQPFISLL